MTYLDNLKELKLSLPVCHWIIDFLSKRKQYIKMGDQFSDPLYLNTIAP